MSDYEGLGEHNILPPPPGKPVRARKIRAKERGSQPHFQTPNLKERKDNVDVSALPDGYTTMMINGMEVLVKKPAVNVQPSSASAHVATQPFARLAPTAESKAIEGRQELQAVKPKKQRKTSYWNLMIKQYGMPKKGTAAYEELKKEYAAYKERNAPKVY